jgi:hypothetical protein
MSTIQTFNKLLIPINYYGRVYGAATCTAYVLFETLLFGLISCENTVDLLTHPFASRLADRELNWRLDTTLQGCHSFIAL